MSDRLISEKPGGLNETGTNGCDRLESLTSVFATGAMACFDNEQQAPFIRKQPAIAEPSQQFESESGLSLCGAGTSWQLPFEPSVWPDSALIVPPIAAHTD